MLTMLKNSWQLYARSFVVVGILASLMTVLTVAPVHAQSSGQAFSISPPLIELSSDPGKTVTAKIKLTNISKGDLSIKAQINDFGAKNETGEPNIIFDDTETSYSLKQWIVAPEPFTLASQESKTLEIPINVPADAEPGGHYSVVRFTGTAPELEDNGVALSASIGSLVLLQVSGDIQTKANVEEFFVATPDGNKTTFFEQGPINLIERIKNDGNVHIKPTGTVEIVDMFGNVISTMRVNGDPNSEDDPPRSILPDSIRKFDQTLDTTWLFGRYEARFNLEYGDNQTLASSTSFWVVPYKLILAVLLVLAIIVTLLVLGIRKYNAFIVRKATGEQKPPKAKRGKKK